MARVTAGGGEATRAGAWEAQSYCDRYSSTVVLLDEEKVFGRGGVGLLAPTEKRTISYFAREYCTRVLRARLRVDSRLAAQNGIVHTDS